MHRTDADANVANHFDQGDPDIPRLPTQVDVDWLNAVQEELCNAIEGASITLVKGTNTQLATALSGLRTAISGLSTLLVQRARASFQFTSLGASFQIGTRNVSGVTKPGSNKVRVTFSAAMPNTTYTVTGQAYGANGYHLSTIDRHTGYVEFEIWDPVTVATIDPTATNLTFDIVVDGAS